MRRPQATPLVTPAGQDKFPRRVIAPERVAELLRQAGGPQAWAVDDLDRLAGRLSGITSTIEAQKRATPGVPPERRSISDRLDMAVAEIRNVLPKMLRPLEANVEAIGFARARLGDRAPAAAGAELAWLEKIKRLRQLQAAVAEMPDRWHERKALPWHSTADLIAALYVRATGCKTLSKAGSLVHFVQSALKECGCGNYSPAAIERVLRRHCEQFDLLGTEGRRGRDLAEVVDAALDRLGDKSDI